MMSHNHMSPEMIIRYNVSSVDMRRPSSGKAVADISKQWMEANPRNFLDLDRPHRHRKTARATPSIQTRKSEFNAQSFCLEDKARLYSTCYCSLSLDVNSFESTDLLVDPYHKLPHVHLHYHVFKVKSVEFVNTIAKSKTDRSGNVKAIIMFNSILSSASPHSPRSKPRTTGCKLKTSRSPTSSSSATRVIVRSTRKSTPSGPPPPILFASMQIFARPLPPAKTPHRKSRVTLTSPAVHSITTGSLTLHGRDLRQQRATRQVETPFQGTATTDAYKLDSWLSLTIVNNWYLNSLRFNNPRPKNALAIVYGGYVSNEDCSQSNN